VRGVLPDSPFLEFTFTGNHKTKTGFTEVYVMGERAIPGNGKVEMDGKTSPHNITPVTVFSWVIPNNEHTRGAHLTGMIDTRYDFVEAILLILLLSHISSPL